MFTALPAILSNTSVSSLDHQPTKNPAIRAGFFIGWRTRITPGILPSALRASVSSFRCSKSLPAILSNQPASHPSTINQQKTPP